MPNKSEHYLPGDNHKIRGEEQRGENIRLYVSKNLPADLRAITVSKIFGIGLSSFHHVFKKHTGQAYGHYVEETRMNTAYHLLQAPGARIKEVMYATGYRNRKTFNNAFKKRFHQPPGYFKK